ncbi:hypothetical protein ACQ4PT_010128 [Festuca glaucescens]
MVGSSMVLTEPSRDAGYVMLSNLLCATGQWTEAERVRRAMSEHGVKKSPGCSWIQVKGAVKVFVSSGGQELDPSDIVCGIIHLLDEEVGNTPCSIYGPNTAVAGTEDENEQTKKRVQLSI